MELPRSTPGDDSVDLSAAPWFTTLGDLLTLLLCFFLAAISFTSSEIIERRVKNGVTARMEGGSKLPGALPRRSVISGTQVAPQMTRESVIDFAETDFNRDGSELEGEKKTELHRIVERIKGIKRATIFSCSRRGARSEVNWNLSIAQATGILGQLIDTGIEPERVNVQALGPQCDGVEWKRSAVSRVVFTY